MQQQPQPICNEVVTTSKVVAKWESQSGTRDRTRDVRGYTIGTGKAQGSLCKIRSQRLNKKPDVDIDLQVQGVSQNAILQDEAKCEKSISR